MKYSSPWRVTTACSHEISSGELEGGRLAAPDEVRAGLQAVFLPLVGTLDDLDDPVACHGRFAFQQAMPRVREGLRQ